VWESPPQHQKEPRAFEVAGSIDTERNGVNERHVDAHAVLERAQLLQALALLEQALRQRDEALESLAAIRIEADVMIDRALARRHGRAAEVVRAGDRAARREGDHWLDHRRV